MNVLDLLLLLWVGVFGALGYRQGFIVGVFSLAGFLAGGTAVVVLAPRVFDVETIGPAESLLAVALVLMSAALGQLLAGRLGHVVRRRVTSSGGRAADATAGAVISVVVLLIVTWFLASALRPGPIPELSRQIAGSSVVTTVDRVMPPQARTAFSSFRRILDNNPLPPVFGGLQPERIRPVSPPARAVAMTPALRAAARSIVDVTSTGSECRRQVKATGFVFAPQYVMTNAHVVAGVKSPEVAVAGRGRSYSARVVAYDAGRDLAVLFVPGLRAPPLEFRLGANRGDEAVVAGFPQGGPLQLEAARIRETIVARGTDIYHSRQVRREIFSLYADVEPGNSGGPLLSPAGDVYGVVFAKSLDDPDTGYALTAKEAAPVATKALDATRAISTGRCA